VDQNRVGFVHVDDAHAVGLENDVGFEQNVLQRRHERSERRNLNRFYS
jgi:hypothetical protein